jgi:hypothetical protein
MIGGMIDSSSDEVLLNDARMGRVMRIMCRPD